MRPMLNVNQIILGPICDKQFAGHGLYQMGVPTYCQCYLCKTIVLGSSYQPAKLLSSPSIIKLFHYIGIGGIILFVFLL